MITNFNYLKIYEMQLLLIFYFTNFLGQTKHQKLFAWYQNHTHNLGC